MCHVNISLDTEVQPFGALAKTMAGLGDSHIKRVRAECDEFALGDPTPTWQANGWRDKIRWTVLVM
jgi:hypothetical protein